MGTSVINSTKKGTITMELISTECPFMFSDWNDKYNFSVVTECPQLVWSSKKSEKNECSSKFRCANASVSNFQLLKMDILKHLIL